MAVTVRDMLTKSFRFGHILGAGDVMADDEAADALEVLNDIIEQANIDKTLAYYQTSIIVPYVSNKLSYTIGPASSTPDVVAPRPVEIISGYSRRNLIDLPVTVASKQDYDRIQQKDIGIGGWTQLVYFEAGFPKGTLYVYQKPLDSLTELHLAVMAEVLAFATLDDVVSVPPVYRAWMKYKTAQRLCPEYGFTFTDDMRELLIDVESALKRNNMKPMPVATSGLSSLGKEPGNKYNVYADTVRK